jgi:hypothetical protein
MHDTGVAVKDRQAKLVAQGDGIAQLQPITGGLLKK